MTAVLPSLAQSSVALFRAAHAFRCAGQTGGRAWEAAAEAALRATAGIAASYRATDVIGLSGTRYQVDGIFRCSEGLVVCEWKSHLARPPRKDLLSFIASVGDIVSVLSPAPSEPVFLMFGGPIVAGRALRHLSAHYGVVLLELHRWPGPVLADPRTRWNSIAGPTASEAETLALLSRPIDDSAAKGRCWVSGLTRLHDRWSDHLWEELDSVPGAFETWIAGAVTA